ncbi:CLUMA_CG021639, isoform A [Clunio marinus]|uniref:CLUMA_CG021639, isoform A n=1 Tax=Clunio marinus TaxID=568069 RepID=A0A1J1J8C3_9DIPT|nr:CLUMA_CG021639, isoform A [Clunio marinus]
MNQITCKYICVPPEYIFSADGLPGLSGCSLICNDDDAGECATKTYGFSHDFVSQHKTTIMSGKDENE